MKINQFLAIALVTLFSLCALTACDSKDMKDKVGGTLADAKDKVGDMSLDGLKKQFNEFGIADIESKAKEMGKLDVPAIKKLLAEKLNVEKLMAGINKENMVAKLKELAPKMDNLGELVKQAKAALGM